MVEEKKNSIFVVKSGDAAKDVPMHFKLLMKPVKILFGSIDLFKCEHGAA